ncbi:MAG: general secretion pathway protein GspB [Planctomycetes bacterium]|nr:general secretion pathway protein GspB [Planctomycetota bacterium]
MSNISNVKILTWLQLCTIAAVIIFACFYHGPRQTAAAQRGIIDGIIYSVENPSVLVDGQVLNEGDTLYGVEVLKIGRRIVIFEKDGQRWEQRVRQRPNPAWDEPDEQLEADTDDS